MPENVNLESCPESESRLPLQPEGPIKQNKWQGLSVGGGEQPGRTGRPGAETWPKLSNLLAISASVARHTPLTPAPAQSALDLLLLLLSRL